MSMRTLSLLLLAAILSACSQSEKLTISCYGTLVATIGNNQPTVSKITRTYIFENLKFADYDCITKDNVIICTAVKDENGTRENKRIIYDTKSLPFSETDVVRDLAKINDPAQNLISRNEFVGTCQKPIIQ
jgi:hypothetical protein